MCEYLLFSGKSARLELFETILSVINSWLADTLRGYAFTIIFLVIAYWVLVNQKKETRSLLEFANKMYVIIASIAMIGYITEMLYGWFGPYGQDYKVFIGYRVLGPWKWVFWMAFAGAYVLPQLYWFRKLRSFTALVIVIALMMHIDDLVEFFSQSYRDYYSLWWNFGGEQSSWMDYLYYFIFPVLLALFYYVRKRQATEN